MVSRSALALTAMGAKTIRGIDEDLWRKVRIEALRRGMTMQEFVILLLKQAVSKAEGKDA